MITLFVYVLILFNHLAHPLPDIFCYGSIGMQHDEVLAVGTKFPDEFVVLDAVDREEGATFKGGVLSAKLQRFLSNLCYERVNY